MNFLAHLFLSGNDEEIMVGNFIADHHRGNHFDKFSPQIIKGIQLHRAIDTFTDKHLTFDKSRNLLHNKYHKYSGIVVDMYYDHFLALHWEKYNQISLENYTLKVYTTIIKYYKVLPAETKRILPFMIFSNWLLNYRDFNELHQRFCNMAKRIKNQSPFETAVNTLKDHYLEIENDFFLFFPELISFVNNYKMNYDGKF